MKNLLVCLSLLLLFPAPETTFANQDSSVPEYTVEGLKLVPNTEGMALVWAEPGAVLSEYDRVYLVEPYVAFKKNWQRDQNRGTIKVKTSDMERIKADIKELFLEVFSEELENGGYTLADERADDVLILKPAIIDLDVNAPDISSAGRTNTYAKNAGSMTLYLELYDAQTDDLLAKTLDNKADRDHSYMRWQSGPANRSAAKRMMKSWAEALLEGLDEARNTAHEK
mgnify:FL=1